MDDNKGKKIVYTEISEDRKSLFFIVNNGTKLIYTIDGEYDLMIAEYINNLT